METEKDSGTHTKERASSTRKPHHQRSPRRRSPATRSRRNKPPHPSPSPSRRRSNYKSIKPVKILKRCSSAPELLSGGSGGDVDDDVDVEASGRYMRSGGGGTFVRPQTFSDAFLSSPSLFPSSPLTHANQGYDKEAKVVMNVTVEGSAGPVRTMVKLGSTVEETIRRVVDIYNEEGRSPKLDLNNVASQFQLHHSYFSLQSMEKSQVIGDVGSRSFYLRKISNIGASSLNSSHSETIGKRSSAPSIANPPMLLPSFIARKISKIVRRVNRLWNIVVCSQ